MRWPLIVFILLLSFKTFAQISDGDKKLLKDLVEINSSTDNLEGLERMRSRLTVEFEALGFVAKTLDVSNGHKVLIFLHPQGSPKIALIGHVDTVFHKDSSFQQFTDLGDKIKGPGVNDMKGGIVLMLSTLNELKNSEALKSIKIILNDDEEIGSPNSAATLKLETKGIPFGLVYEPTLTSSDHVTTTQAGVEWLELKVKGLASHAGAEHPKGINACVELSHKIIQISKLTNYKKNLTINPGVIQGGTKANVVCEEAQVKLDIRYVEDNDLKDVRKKLDQIASKSTIINPILKRGTQSSITQIVHIPSLSKESTQNVFNKAQTVAKNLGYILKREHMGGASDANQLASTGMQLLAGLGPWGTGAHSTDEVIDVGSFAKRKELNVALIKELLK